MRTAAGRRRFTFLRGLSAERAALVWLVLKGWRPLARRYAGAGGEIDLVMRRGRTIAFVVVWGGGLLVFAATSFDVVMRGRLRRAARAWLTRHPWAAGLTLRADAVFVATGAWPRHVPDVFSLD